MGGIFQRVGEGMEKRGVRGKRERRRQEIEKELSKEKVRKVIRKLKDGKAMEMGGILNESVKVWERGSGGYNEVWKGEDGIPE